jgi:hypothetical protein
MRRLPRCLALASVLLVLAACGTQSTPGGVSTPVGSRPATPPRAVTAQAVAKDGGLECPASVQDGRGTTVPEKPQGVDGAARLLPDRAPLSLVDCAYRVVEIQAASPSKPPFALTKRTHVATDRVDDVVELLAWAPRGDARGRVCTMIGGDETVHLVGARYDDAVVWVASLAEPNGCSTATNGDFMSPLAAGFWLEQWFGNGPAGPKRGACDGWATGRLGDDVSLAPDGEPTVTVCRPTNSGQQAHRLTRDQSRQVVDALRGLRTRATDYSCGDGDPAAGNDFRLVLQYARGNDVVIQVLPSCTPQLMSGSLDAKDAGPVIDLVEQWSAPVPGYDPNGSVSSTG